MALPFDEKFRRACNPGPERQLPGAVLLAADRDGSIVYSNCQGFTSLEEDKAKPITRDTTFWIASCTKLLTTVAAMQCVERGLLSLDDESQVSTLLPELASTLKILTGFDSTGEPEVQDVDKRITLRQLLTHSSGLGYDFLSPKLAMWTKWRTKLGDNPDQMIDYSPLLYEPGEGWGYSVSIDWTGLLIERVNSNMTLEAYMREHILGPLGMDATTFQLDAQPHVRARLCAMTVRLKNGDIAASPPSPGMVTSGLPRGRGGGGLYSSPNDYIKFLITLLKNDGTLLKPETVDLMFEPQLKDNAGLSKATATVDGGGMVRGGVESKEWNFGLGGILNMEDVPGLCTKGTMSWSGLPNLYWWIDRQANLCGLYASQMLPPGDSKSLEMAVEFRRRAYQKPARL